MLKVNNLIKNYKKTVAVKGITFNLHAGEIVGILGPNGAGKSTTIKCICGLIKPTSGVINIKGLPHTNLEIKRLMGYVPEVPEIYDLLTVWEHLEFIAKAYRLTNWTQEAEHLLARYELIDKRDTLGQELSKGMKQKVSLAMALIIKPEVMLFDEPMIGLDPKAIRETKAIMKELATSGCAVIVSTHLLDTIETLCDNVLVMKDGLIIANGSPEELKSQWGSEGDSLEEVFLEVTKDA